MINTNAAAKCDWAMQNAAPSPSPTPLIVKAFAEMRAPAAQNPFDGRPTRLTPVIVRRRIIRFGFRLEIMGEDGQRPHRQLQQ
jgi:hypothetical protein